MKTPIGLNSYPVKVNTSVALAVALAVIVMVKPLFETTNVFAGIPVPVITKPFTIKELCEDRVMVGLPDAIVAVTVI